MFWLLYLFLYPINYLNFEFGIRKHVCFSQITFSDEGMMIMHELISKLEHFYYLCHYAWSTSLLTSHEYLKGSLHIFYAGWFGCMKEWLHLIIMQYFSLISKSIIIGSFLFLRPRDYLLGQVKIQFSY